MSDEKPKRHLRVLHPSMKHGHAVTGKRPPEYAAWISMKERCYSKNHSSYHLYGGRGITVCARWRQSFANFFADMGYRPQLISTKGRSMYSLERKNRTRGYSLDNCEWATAKAQARNRETNRLITFKNRTMPVIDWAAEIGVKPGTLYWRLRAGWSARKTLTYCRWGKNER